MGELIRDQTHAYVQLLTDRWSETTCSPGLSEVLKLCWDRLSVLDLEELEPQDPVLNDAIFMEVVQRQDTNHLSLEIDRIEVVLES